jgi:hypothetical protein
LRSRRWGCHSIRPTVTLRSTPRSPKLGTALCSAHPAPLIMVARDQDRCLWNIDRRQRGQCSTNNDLRRPNPEFLVERFNITIARPSHPVTSWPKRPQHDPSTATCHRCTAVTNKVAFRSNPRTRNETGRHSRSQVIAGRGLDVALTSAPMNGVFSQSIVAGAIKEPSTPQAAVPRERPSVAARFLDRRK